MKGLFKVAELEVDHALTTTLVERWSPKMHSFHLPHEEIGITLQDIGGSCEWVARGWEDNLKWKELCIELLGHQPLDPIPHPNENKSILVRARVRVSWLEAQFRGPLTADASDAVEQQHAHYHVLVWLGSILFMGKSVERVSVMPL